MQHHINQARASYMVVRKIRGHTKKTKLKKYKEMKTANKEIKAANKYIKQLANV